MIGGDKNEKGKWQIADALKMCETAFSKKLRKEVTVEEKNEILAIIDELAK